MPNEHIDINIPKAISLATGSNISQDRVARRAVASSVKTANRSVRLPAPRALHILSNILQNTVSAVIAVLDASRPRILRLARRASSGAIFVGVLLILTSLFTIEGVAQFPTITIITPGYGKVTLSWTPVSVPGTGYEYRHHLSSLSPTATSTWISTGSTRTTYTITTGLTNGLEYSFYVSGVYASSGKRAILPIPPPGLTATPGDGRIDLSWTAPASSSINGYQWRRDSDPWTSIPDTQMSLTQTDLTNGDSYTFQVRAVNSFTRYSETTPVSVTGATSYSNSNTFETRTRVSGKS